MAALPRDQFPEAGPLPAARQAADEAPTADEAPFSESPTVSLAAALSTGVHDDSIALTAYLADLDQQAGGGRFGAEYEPAVVDFEPWPAADNDVIYVPLPDAAPSDPAGLTGLWDNVLRDHGNYYSRNNLALLAVGTGVAGVIANTRADGFINDDVYQDTVRNARTDEYFEAIHSMKLFGEGKYALPLYATAVTAGWLVDGEGGLGAAGQWGERSLRTILVGAPPMLAMQRVLGASRPGETSSGSHWEPFYDDNGVSGHAFMGAIPFITAAQMMESRWAKAGLYAGSTLAGLSRVNDNHHYTSQVVMGWWMAYLAARSVSGTETGIVLQPVVQTTADSFSGVLMEKSW